MSSSETLSEYSRTLLPIVARPPDHKFVLPQGVDDAFCEFLTLCNGGYTPDYLFHFFGTYGPPEHDIFAWNEPKLWKAEYGLDDGFFVFAEDILGCQMGFTLGTRRKVIKSLNVETGEHTVAAENFMNFLALTKAERLVALDANIFNAVRKHLNTDYQIFTHISCKTPSFLGGHDDDLNNLEFCNSLDHLRFLGQLLNQVKGLPRGTVIKDIFIDRENGIFRLIT